MTAGGTTTDAGVLVNGLPRPAAATVDIAGVRTNFVLPDILSTGSLTTLSIVESTKSFMQLVSGIKSCGAAKITCMRPASRG